MVKCILIKKGGNVKCSNLKLSSLDEIHKKCGFMNNNNFDHRNIWSLDNSVFYSIFAKNKGKAGTENKYELPPPVDSTLFFGTMIILKHSDKMYDIDNLQDLTLDEWNNVYETLFGGFEDLDSNEEMSEDEEIDEENLTKEGYLKDDFVVDDEDSIENEDSEFEDISEEYEDDEEDEEDDEQEEDNDDEQENEEEDGEDEEDEEEYEDDDDYDEEDECLTEESISETEDEDDEVDEGYDSE